MNVSGSYLSNIVYHKPASESPNPRFTDDFYKLKLQGSLKGKYAIVLVGHSGNGYQEGNNALCVSIRNKIEEIMSSRGLKSDEVIIIAGGTPEGIGAAYEVASDMRLDSLGIVASQGEEYCSRQCRTLIIMLNQDENDWRTTLPESNEEMVVTALHVAQDTGQGGELLAYNGGPQAYTEVLSAANDGYKVTLIRDFKPVDKGREQPFSVEDNLRTLKNAGVRFEGE